MIIYLALSTIKPSVTNGSTSSVTTTGAVTGKTIVEVFIDNKLVDTYGYYSRSIEMYERDLSC
jgi:hypothetical protein